MLATGEHQCSLQGFHQIGDGYPSTRTLHRGTAARRKMRTYPRASDGHDVAGDADRS